MELGTVSQAGFAFRSVLDSVSLIVNRFGELSALRAETARLEQLLAALEARTH